MNTQFRVLVVALGALLVAATYTFPIWQPWLNQLPGNQEVFPGLPAQLSEAFLLLPQEQRAALDDLLEEEPDLARQLALAQLSGDSPVPAAQQEMPEDLVGRVTIALGDFVPALAAVSVDGQLTIYELADARKILRFDNVEMTNVPGMTVYLANNPAPATAEDLFRGDQYVELAPLQGNVGSQNYAIAAEIDLSTYNSVVLYSSQLDLVVGYAQLNKLF